ncbi:hypothetical protein GGH93_001324 [Coemansia aciculifera]|nr:hypothetical protein GGH93_001324 [Coemansia aciculifera]
MNRPKNAPGKLLQFTLEVRFENGEPMKEYDMEVDTHALVRDLDDLVSTQHGGDIVFDMDTLLNVRNRDCPSTLFTNGSFNDNAVENGDTLRVAGTNCEQAKYDEDSKDKFASEPDCNSDEDQHPCTLYGK